MLENYLDLWEECLRKKDLTELLHKRPKHAAEDYYPKTMLIKSLNEKILLSCFEWILQVKTHSTMTIC